MTRNGVPVGVLQPVQRRRFVAASALAGLFADAAPIEPDRFRADVDQFVSQEPGPHA